jgi:adenylate kinase family enzyme
MQRILILGSGGAGKTTVAARLGTILELPVIHLDASYWSAGWTHPTAEQWEDKVRELATGARWVMDGNYSASLKYRLPRADTVIFLDFPRWLRMVRVMRRLLFNFGRTRPDMGEDCPERFDARFLMWIWNYEKRSRPRVLAMLESQASHATVLRFCSPSELQQWLDSLSGAKTVCPVGSGISPHARRTQAAPDRLH